MPDREIIKIPANRTLADLRRKKRKLRVAAYCRVSSSSEDQLNSFAAQNIHYTQYIMEHEDWRLVDIYADEGLTGTEMKKRDELNRLIGDAKPVSRHLSQLVISASTEGTA